MIKISCNKMFVLPFVFTYLVFWLYPLCNSSWNCHDLSIWRKQAFFTYDYMINLVSQISPSLWPTPAKKMAEPLYSLLSCGIDEVYRQKKEVISFDTLWQTLRRSFDKKEITLYVYFQLKLKLFTELLGYKNCLKLVVLPNFHSLDWTVALKQSWSPCP